MKVFVGFARRSILILTFATLLSGCKTVLYSSLPEAVANEMVSVLLANEIAATKIEDGDGITIEVNEVQFSEAVQLLKSVGLPRDTYTNKGEIFDAEGMVASPIQEWAKLNYAQTQQLAQSISAIPGVVRVSVNIAEKRLDGPFDTPEPPSAAVVVQVEEGSMTDELLPQIKELVAFSVPEISYDRVGVILAPVETHEVVQNMVSLNGLLVHRESVQIVRVMALVAIIASIATISLSVFSFFNWRSLQKTKSALEAG